MIDTRNYSEDLGFGGLFLFEEISSFNTRLDYGNYPEPTKFELLVWEVKQF